MNRLKIVLAILLAFVMILTGSACGNVQNQPSESSPMPEATTPEASTPSESTPNESTPGETDPIVPPEVNVTTYNIVFALATIPPVLAALECIGSGFPTYVIIERGKTYSGIDSVDSFINVGFDPANNLSNGFTAKEFDAMAAKIKELNESTENAYFNIYVQDGTALKGAAIAANAGLREDQFHVYMCEDGTGAYDALYKKYMKDMVVSGESDGVYDNYLAKVAEAEAEFKAIMAKSDNKNGDAVLFYNIGKAFALASLDNFTYYIQDENLIIDILENTGAIKTKLLSAFGVKGYNDDVERKLNLKYGKISAAVSKLSEEQRTDYLTLMYGQYYADTYAALTRTERGDKSAPAKKLVFIGSRHSDYPDLVSNASFGIGGLPADGSVPKSYAELDAKYKTALLFATEADYNVFLNVINNNDNYTEELADDVKAMVEVACFNYYVDYIFTLKLTYALYGNDYDIIMKGHPRESIGSWAEWNNRYKVTYGEDQKYVFDKLLDNALLGFHNSDSTGKYIGMVPYGTAAENLAYLGADISIAGLPSSTYSGFDTDVDVLFILAQTNQDIVGSGEATAASQVKERYEAGNLLYTNKYGNKVTSVFYNVGNLYKAISAVYAEAGNNALAAKYTESFNTWIASVHPEHKDIDDQGFPVEIGKE